MSNELQGMPCQEERCHLHIGKAYTAKLGLEPGDEFEIKLGKKQIRLVPVGGHDEEE